jgi:hypothetical protein
LQCERDYGAGLPAFVGDEIETGGTDVSDHAMHEGRAVPAIGCELLDSAPLGAIRVWRDKLLKPVDGCGEGIGIRL